MDLFATAFQGQESVLVEKIDPDHGLWRQLKDRGVLTQEQIDDCRSSVHVCQY